MNRTIKFRAWDAEKRIMIPGITLGALTHWTSVNHYLWMQFTGLLDRNGKEIYEGDIVTDNESEGREFDIPKEVMFSEGYFGLRTFYPEDSKRSYNSIFMQEDYEYVVIGNKWENPELLK